MAVVGGGSADYLMVMPLEWRTLAQGLHQAAWSPSWREALHLGAALAEALAHVHSQGFLHRDIKPANVLQGIISSLPGHVPCKCSDS